MTKRDILDVRTKHAGGRPTGHGEEAKTALAIIENELKRRRQWGQRLDDNREIATRVAEVFGRGYRSKAVDPTTNKYGATEQSIPGPNAGWRVKSEFWAEGYDDSLEREIAARLKVTPSDLAKHAARVTEELDKLLNDPESRAFYFEYDPDLEYDIGHRVHSLGAVVGHIKRFKKDHPEFKTRKRAGSKAKSPKP